MEKEQIERRIEETLKSLDGIRRVPVVPGFHRRVMERIQQQRNGEGLKPVFVFRFAAVCTMIIGLNILVCLHYHKAEKAYTGAALQAFSSEYFKNDIFAY